MNQVDTSVSSIGRARDAAAKAFNLGSVLSFLLLLVLLGGWQYSVRAGWVPAFVLPAPSDIATRIVADVLDPVIWYDCLYTLTEIVVGFLIAFSCGLIVGTFVALVPLVDRIVTPYIVALQTIPKVAIAPVLIIWFGFGIASKIVIVALISFFPILVNVVLGFRTINPRQLVLMKVLDASSWQVFCKVRLPNALPSIMAGVHIAMILSVIGAIVGEFLGSPYGLGAQIMQRQAAMDVVGVYSVLAILTSIGIILNTIVKMISRKLVFWGDSGNPRGV